MTYTSLAVLGVFLALAIDRFVLRTRITSTSTWWLAYAIIVFFQLLTNGWLTGRRIVQYNPDTILGDGSVVMFGSGRIMFAPVEDLMFGFALVLLTVSVWTWLGRRDARRPESGAAR